MKKILIALITIIFLASCSTNNQIEKYEVEMKEKDLELNEIDISSFKDDGNYIQLNTIKDNFIYFEILDLKCSSCYPMSVGNHVYQYDLNTKQSKQVQANKDSQIGVEFNGGLLSVNAIGPSDRIVYQLVYFDTKGQTVFYEGKPAVEKIRVVVGESSIYLGISEIDRSTGYTVKQKVLTLNKDGSTIDEKEIDIKLDSLIGMNLNNWYVVNGEVKVVTFDDGTGFFGSNSTIRPESSQQQIVYQMTDNSVQSFKAFNIEQGEVTPFLPKNMKDQIVFKSFYLNEHQAIISSVSNEAEAKFDRYKLGYMFDSNAINIGVYDFTTNQYIPVDDSTELKQLFNYQVVRQGNGLNSFISDFDQFFNIKIESNTLKVTTSSLYHNRSDRPIFMSDDAHIIFSLTNLDDLTLIPTGLFYATLD